MAEYSGKVFNAEAFEAYVRTIPDLSRDELINSGVVVQNTSLAGKLKDQIGGNYIIEPMKGLLEGTPENYDGATDITSTQRKTYNQGKIVIGRAHAWDENDFAYDITGGVDFLATAREVGIYFNHTNQKLLLSILKGIFAMTGSPNTNFTTNHTHDISAAETTTDADAQKMSVDTLNNAIQKACGDNKGIFTIVIMHSAIATRLENKQLLEYWKYTDANGIQRQLPLASWNGKTVLVDDTMPTSGSGANTVYTTYVLGRGAFEYADCGAKVPFEMDRNPATNGGKDTIYGRERVLYAPAGISFAPSSIPTSPTDNQLEAGASWKIAQDANGNAVPHRAIPIVRILCKN